MKQYFKKNSLYFLLLASFAALIAVFACLFSNLYFAGPDLDLKKDDKTTLYPKHTVTQVFRSGENGLSRIKIILKDNGLGFGEKISIELADEKCGNGFFKENISFYSAVLSDADTFSFSRIADSKDVLFCLKITYLGKNRKKSQLPSIITSEKTFETFYYFNPGEKDHPQEMLLIRPKYSAENMSKNIETLVKRMSQYKPWFFKGNWLILISASFVFSTLILVFILITI